MMPQRQSTRKISGESATLIQGHSYPPIAIGCCFYRRERNYQSVIHSIGAMADAYPGPVHAYVYLADHTPDTASELLAALKYDPRRFTFGHGVNRFDEQKYLLPLLSDSRFIVTVDDDCCFGPCTLIRLMNTYLMVAPACSDQPPYPAVGWFGTELREDHLLTPIEDRYSMQPGDVKQVDYLGSCGCLYRREVLSGARLRLEDWPSYIGAASDLWLSYLLNAVYSSPAYITWLDRRDLDEHGHSLWNNRNEAMFAGIVDALVASGWRAFPRAC